MYGQETFFFLLFHFFLPPSYPALFPPFFLSLCSFSGQSLRYSACPLCGLDWLWVPGFLASTSQVWDYRCAPEHSAWWRVLNKSWSSHIRAITLFAEWALSLHAMIITQHQTQAKWLHANDLIGILDYCVSGVPFKSIGVQTLTRSLIPRSRN